jgi:hypothetical protein
MSKPGVMSRWPGPIAAWPPWLSRAVLVVAALLTLAVAMGPPREPPPPSTASAGHGAAGPYTDRELYLEIARKVASGQDYYAATTATQRAHGYPTWPPWAVREPTLAWLLTLLPNDLVRWGALLLLAAVAVVLMRDAADLIGAPRWRSIAVTLLFGVGLAIVGVPAAPYLHEDWAAVLIGLSLACWRPDGRRWILAVAFGLSACLVRELALPYLLVMAGFAAAERRKGEFLGWCAALAVLAAALAVHFALAARQHLPGDGFSPGWVRFGGWPFAVLAARRNIILAVLPAPLASLVLLAGLLGLVSARSPWTGRIAGTACAFLLLFMAVGRPENYYWGLIVAPLLAMGLPFAPAALGELVRAAWVRPGRVVKQDFSTKA